MNEPPQHRELAIEECSRDIEACAVEVAPSFGNAQRGSHLGCAARCDAKQVQPILALAPPAFVERQRDAARRAPDLARQISVRSLEPSDGLAQGCDELDCDFECVHVASSVAARPRASRTPEEVRGRAAQTEEARDGAIRRVCERE
jgi:hypothetical protein